MARRGWGLFAVLPSPHQPARTATHQSPPSPGSLAQVSKQDMNRLVMDYLVTEGYVDAAAAFEAESGAQPGCQLSSITDRMEIRRAVQAGDVPAAIERVNDLNPEVRAPQSPCRSSRMGRGPAMIPPQWPFMPAALSSLCPPPI